jgi:hypothetical protein
MLEIAKINSNTNRDGTQDHPHVYINVGEADTILCPNCATRFRFDPRLTPLDADPPESFFSDHYEA